MKKLQWRVDRKKDILKRYHEGLKNVEQIKFFDQDLEYTTPWFIAVFAEDRENLQNYLKEQGVGTRVMYPPINKQKAYQQPVEYPISNIIGEKGLWLPSAAQLTDNEIIKITSDIRQFYS